MALATDYTGLITSQHADKPNYMAMVGDVAQCFVDQINLMLSMPAAFDIDDAIGAQLDQVGIRVGITRDLDTPINGVYFAFDTAGVGFDQGVWQGPFDPDDGITSLDDDTYRLLLKAKIGTNNWDGTHESTLDILQLIFPLNVISNYVTDIGGNHIVAMDSASGQLLPVGNDDDQTTYAFVQDNADMTISYGLSGIVPSALFIALLSGGHLPLKPATVRITDYYLTSISGTPLFGFDTDNRYIGGFDVGSWGIPV